MGYKIPIMKNGGATFYLEPYATHLFVHCDVVDSPSKSLIKDMLSKWKKFREVTCMDLYALHTYKNKSTHKHFLSLFGFKFLENRIAKNGDSVELWINRGNLND